MQPAFPPHPVLAVENASKAGGCGTHALENGWSRADRLRRHLRPRSDASMSERTAQSASAGCAIAPGIFGESTFAPMPGNYS
jgi:hypothetical protein